jgi:hypothetical protein
VASVCYIGYNTELIFIIPEEFERMENRLPGSAASI